MNPPRPGDTFTRKGEPDVIVTAVTKTSVSWERYPHTFTMPLAQFLTLREATIKRSIAANLNNITEDDEV